MGKKIAYHFENFSFTKISLILLLVLGLSGCSNTILDKHNESMQKNPGKNHYATAMPFGSYENSTQNTNRTFAYNEACRLGGKKRSYLWNLDVYQMSYYLSYGGRSQGEVEAHVLQQCENENNRTCIVVLYNKYDVCDVNFDSAFNREQERIAQRTKNRELIAFQKNQKNTEQITQTCLSFGFKINSPQLSNCVLELHKSALQIQAIRNASISQTSAIENANAEARKLREFEQGMMLLQSSANLLNATQPNRSTVKCRFNTYMKSITCQ